MFIMWIVIAFLFLIGQNVEALKSITEASVVSNNATTELVPPIVSKANSTEDNDTRIEDNMIIGSSLVSLSVEKCYEQECILGNFVTDVMVYAFRDEISGQSWTYSSVAIINPDVLQDGLAAGDIYLDDLMTAVPYYDTLIVGEIEGRYIKEIFEYNCSVKQVLQVSGIKVVIDASRPQGDRVQSLKMRCQNCTIPVYERIDLDQTYRIITTSSLANDTQHYTLFSQHLMIIKTGPAYGESFRDYLASQSPVFKEESGRITLKSSSIQVLPSLFVYYVLSVVLLNKTV